MKEEKGLLVGIIPILVIWFIASWGVIFYINNKFNNELGKYKDALQMLSDKQHVNEEYMTSVDSSDQARPRYEKIQNRYEEQLRKRNK